MSKLTEIVNNIISVINNTVRKTGDQTIAGIKTFSSSPIVPTPALGDNSTKVATTAFVLANGDTKLASDGLAIVKQNNSNIKNQCTAWVNFNGTTTPPTISDSYNVSSVVRTDTGRFDVYFENNMNNANYATTGASRVGSATMFGVNIRDINMVSCGTINYLGNYVNESETTLLIFGGKN